MARHISWTTRFLATPGSNPGAATTFQPFRSPLSPYFLHRRESRCRILSRLCPSVESPVRLVGAVCLDQNDAWSHAQSLTDARSLWKGYKSPGLPAAGEEAIERVLTLVEVAFMDKLGKVA